MKAISLLLAYFLAIAVMVISGCQFLPPLPMYTQTVPVLTTTLIPQDLTAAAERILPSTVIVDTRIATGTGWIFDSSGIVVTNYHVIEGAGSVTVTLHDGRRLRVNSMATDPIGDLAILRINATGLPAAVLGSSSSLRVGEPVVAAGNSLGEGISIKTGQVTRLNITVGIESAQYYGLIEDNAPIQEGDSGGPLVNRAGEVIGISNAKVIGMEDIGYAISIDSALPLIRQLINNGSVARAYLGISGSDNPNGSGVLLEMVVSGGPADTAGLRLGDVILAIDGENMTGIDDLVQKIRSEPIGQQIKITYQRGSSKSETSATLVQMPVL